MLLVCVAFLFMDMNLISPNLTAVITYTLTLTLTLPFPLPLALPLPSKKLHAWHSDTYRDITLY